MSARYLGNKARTANRIVSVISTLRPARVVDVFCGTGTISGALVREGVQVTSNDSLACAVVMTRAATLTEQTLTFRGWQGRTATKRYHAAIEELNNQAPGLGFVWAEYAPSGKSASGHMRYYFTLQNAARIDAMRAAIREWSAGERISRYDEALLLGDLIFAINRVANIAGTYGCFLKPWSAPALRSIVMAPRVIPDVMARAEVFNLDYRGVPVNEGDIIYFDPPYTKRQYAAYYHLIETVTIGDTPMVAGITGLRPWESKASPYCYSVKALDEFAAYLEEIQGIAGAIVVSYSSDGHMKHSDLLEVLRSYGSMTFQEFSVGRYSANSLRGSAPRIVERLYVTKLRASPNAISA